MTPVLATTVLLVTTPGVRFEGHVPLIEALRAEGHAVHMVSLPCSGDAASHSAAIARAVARHDPAPVVVAHGIGATLALQADLAARQLVLLAPVLGPPSSAAFRWLTGQPVPRRVDLATPVSWQGRPLREVLLGPASSPLGCLSAELAADLQTWARSGVFDLALEAVTTPTWIAVGHLDELAPPEVVVPASRRLPTRALVRLGVTRLDPRDLTHLDMLTDPIAVRAAARAVERAP